MKFNWKIIVALVVLVGGIFWSVNSLRTRSYSGTDLNFGVGSGPITITNPLDEALPVQLVSTSPGTFTVSSNISGVSGKSTREGTGRNATQFFDFVLPTGVSEFSVLRGADVNFVARAATPLAATIEPLNAEDSRTTLIVAVIAILGSLFYLSHANGHRWISAARRQEALDRTAAQDTEQKTFNRIAGRLTSDKSSSGQGQ
jgi:hypothetical protein